MQNFITSGKIPRAWLLGARGPSQQKRFVLRHRNTVVGGKCALPNALLVAVFAAAIVVSFIIVIIIMKEHS